MEVDMSRLWPQPWFGIQAFQVGFSQAWFYYSAYLSAETLSFRRRPESGSFGFLGSRAFYPGAIPSA
ncbi:MAG: hypothetical protein ACYDGY_00895 [Acidimicrobiales bacterium]